MKRRHLFEIHEQAWCPRLFREGAMDCLRVIAGVGQQYKNILPPLQKALQASHSQQIVDICSGGGGPWFSLAPRLAQLHGQPVPILLTDLYPNLQAAPTPSSPAPLVTVVSTSVDALQIPASLTGFRTLFTAFHHFQPEAAQSILQRAVAQGQGIAIFEQTRRHPLALLAMLFLPLIIWLITPMIRPFRWSRLFWTYVIPIIPTIVCVDGLVSCLRTYTPAELQAFVDALDAPTYVWNIGHVPSPLSPIGITYLIGYPQPPICRTNTDTGINLTLT